VVKKQSLAPCHAFGVTECKEPPPCMPKGTQGEGSAAEKLRVIVHGFGVPQLYKNVQLK